MADDQSSSDGEGDEELGLEQLRILAEEAEEAAEAAVTASLGIMAGASQPRRHLPRTCIHPPCPCATARVAS